jgi:shikimate O-hydroxycinnamoyltransferase
MPQKIAFRTISRTRIRPESGVSGSLSLNALDHFESWFLLEVVYFYRRALDPERLQQSLRQALECFPLLCGQLCTSSDGALRIDYPHSGVLFTACECDLTIEEARKGLHTACTVYNFIEKINPVLFSGKDKPLASFKLTRMKDGGSALGISVAHALTDAYSFYYFIRHWSRIHEGLPAGAPLHDRGLLAATRASGAASPGTPLKLPHSCRGFRLLTPRQLLGLISSFIMQQKSVVCSVLHFSRQQLLAIKNRALRLGPVSTGDALSAHLWLLYARLAKAAEAAAPRRLLIPVNMRPLLNHPQSGDYVGNAIAHLKLSYCQEELDQCDIAAVARQCREQVAGFSREHIGEQMLWLHSQEQKKRLYRVYADIDPYAGDCMISNLSRLPVYGACFDGEQPFWAAAPVIPIPGVLQIFPAPDAGGAVDVHAHLPRFAAEMLRSDTWQAELYKYGEAAHNEDAQLVVPFSPND